ncbi:protein kinase domain-containing protein [Aureispira anguillae]|uniref:Protein kinase n=1 Tax=Aureispira anguillae TaxID=2864201 RepID=A0A915YJC7_9BACT|nr:protein kinase [Aureispira anguillae]BDS13908.1 protein kinase [Aureispira anguillae]
MKEQASINTLREFFEKYEIDQTESLDQKKFGSVYKGIEKERNQEWAIKCSEVHPNFDKGLFEERYQKAKELQHVNLLPYETSYRFVEGMVTNIAVMPLVKMGSLNQHWALSDEDKKLIADQVLDGLYYLHAQGVVWQNLSAQHILLEENFGNYVPKFINYGSPTKIPLAFFVDYEYLAPEQLEDEAPLDLRSDIWAYGVLLYKLWTGRLPFGEKSASLPNAKIQERIIGTKDWELGLMDQIPQPYQRIVEKCLKRKKEVRWNNCGEIIAVIKNWQPSLVPATEKNKTEPEKTEPPRRVLRKPNKPIVWWQVVLLFLLAACLGYLIG